MYNNNDKNVSLDSKSDLRLNDRTLKMLIPNFNNFSSRQRLLEERTFIETMRTIFEFYFEKANVSYCSCHNSG